MSPSFVSVWCEGCHMPFRKRQSLHRHQHKSGCTGSYRDHDKPDTIQIQASSSTLISGVQMNEIFEQLNLKLSNVVKGRYLTDIDDIEGRRSVPISSSPTLDVNGFEAWSQHNGADFIMDLSKLPIPKQLVSGTQVGTMAIYFKL
jgi:hypothetical protein